MVGYNFHKSKSGNALITKRPTISYRSVLKRVNKVGKSEQLTQWMQLFVKHFGQFGLKFPNEPIEFFTVLFGLRNEVGIHSL